MNANGIDPIDRRKKNTWCPIRASQSRGAVADDRIRWKGRSSGGTYVDDTDSDHL
ncbi:hypothetical protein GCM10027089_19820 [Nocardia thraciensis]